MICKKAAELATQMGLDFNPSESWLRRMRIRNNIGWKKAHREKQNVDAPAAQVFIDEKLPQILEKYDPDDIFNCNETGLYWRGVPDRGYHVSSKNNNKPSGVKVPQ